MVIDVFAHVLPPKFLKQMQTLRPEILAEFPYMQNPLLTDMGPTPHKFTGRAPTDYFSRQLESRRLCWPRPSSGVVPRF